MTDDRNDGAKRIDLEGSHSRKLDRVINRQRGKAIKGFDVTLYPSDYGPNMCSTGKKCIRHNAPDGTPHNGAHWPEDD